MNLPNYDFGQPQQLTPEMLTAALRIKLDQDDLRDPGLTDIGLLFAAAQVLKIDVQLDPLDVADQVLLRWPEP